MFVARVALSALLRKAELYLTTFGTAPEARTAAASEALVMLTTKDLPS